MLVRRLGKGRNVVTTLLAYCAGLFLLWYILIPRTVGTPEPSVGPLTKRYVEGGHGIGGSKF